MSQPTFIDLCCGCGGMTLGFIKAGFSCLGGVDFNHWACESFRNYIQAPNHEMGVGEYDENPHIDVLVGGIPCQPASLSGQRLGMRDPRAKVYWDFLDKVTCWRPQLVVIENVVGMLSAADADGVKGGALQHLRRSMMNDGYTVVHSVLNSYDYGVPQKRPRLFIVASREGKMWVPPRQWPKEQRLTVYDAFCDLLGQDDVDLPNHDKVAHGPEMLANFQKMWDEGRWSLYSKFTQSWARLALDLPAPTQTENHGGLCLHPLEHRVITPREMARLQTFPDDWEFLGPKTAVMIQIGNAVPVQLAREVALSIKHMID